MFFYSDSAATGGTVTPYHKQNANAAYIRHFQNLMFLKFVVANSDDRNERQQATIEIPICERKLTYWTRHANFDKDTVQREVDRIKREWASERRRAA